MRFHRTSIGLVGLSVAASLIAGGFVLAQDNADRVTLQFSDPSRPGTVKVSLLQGGITVKAWSGKDVIVASPSSQRVALDKTGQPPPEASGLRRLNRPSGLTFDEENNLMSIGTGFFKSRTDLALQVPVKTNLRLSTVNGGQVVVEGVDGDIEVNNINGSITLTDIAGSVVAHATKGSVLATLKQVTSQKAMSFTSLNGNVDVTLPPSTKANLRLRSDRGDVYTDFDVQIRPGSRPSGDDLQRNTVPPLPPLATTSPQPLQPPRGPHVHLDFDNSVYGSINGGGPEFELRTFNGNIYLRKGK